MLVGYLEFVTLLFLPGFAFIEVFKVKVGSLGETLALAFGLGAPLSVIVLVVASSGYNFAGISLLGVRAATVQLVIAVSAMLILIAVLVRRRLCSSFRLDRFDVILSMLLAAQATLVGLHFLEYPIFPEFSSVDFLQHVHLARYLELGYSTSVPGGILYYGVHELIAALLSVAGGVPLIVAQHAVGILVVFSPLLVYSATLAIVESKQLSLITTAVYVGGGFIWFGSVFNAGLYPNFYGVLAIFLVMIAAGMIANGPRRPVSWLVYLVAVTNLFFSHYSTLTIIPALVSLPVLCLIFTRKVDKALLGLAVLPLIPLAAAVAVEPSLINTLLGFVAASGGGNISGDTPLSSAFVWFPFLRYIIIEITSDTASVFILVMAGFGAYFTLRHRQPLLWLPLVWLISVAVAAPVSEAAWRFSYVALTPLVILASMGLSFLVPKPQAAAVVKRKGRRLATQRRNMLIVATVVLILMVAGSWGTRIVEDAAANAQLNGQAQYDVYNSMLWFSNNTPADSRLVSVTDSRYGYLNLLTGRSAYYAPLITPDDLLPQVKGQQDVYVVLTRLATLVVNGSQGSELLGLYSGNPAFKAVYSNTDVTIYSVNTASG